MNTKEIPQLKRMLQQQNRPTTPVQQRPTNKPGGLKKSPNKRKKTLKINWLLMFAIVCVSIPSLILAWVLYSASLETNIPQEGDRFKDSFAYALSKDDLKKIEQAIATIEGVEKVVVSRPVATVRVYIDVVDTLKDERIKDITLEAYQKIDGLYPIIDYFTYHGNPEKEIVISQYDLEIYSYNNLEFTDNFIFYRLVKNAVSETYTIQNVGLPVDPDLADRLRNKKPMGDGGTVGEEEADDFDDEEIYVD